MCKKMFLGFSNFESVQYRNLSKKGKTCRGLNIDKDIV